MQQQQVPQSEQSQDESPKRARLLLAIIGCVTTFTIANLYIKGIVTDSSLSTIDNALNALISYAAWLSPFAIPGRVTNALKGVSSNKGQGKFSIIFLKNIDDILYKDFKNTLIEKGYKVKMCAWNGEENLDVIIRKEEHEARRVLSIVTCNFLDKAKNNAGYHNFKKMNDARRSRRPFTGRNELLCIHEESLSELKNIPGNLKLNLVDLTKMTKEMRMEAFISHFWGEVTENDKKLSYIGDEAKKNFEFPDKLEYFTGRTEVLHQIRDKLKLGEKAIVTLSGLKGIGKTLIIMHYAKNMIKRYDYMFLLCMSSKKTYEGNLKKIDALLELSKMPESPYDTNDRFKSESILSRKFVNWLEHTSYHWLLLIDDYNDPKETESFRSINGNGHIVLTTSSTEPEHIKVLPMGREEGALFLLRCTGILEEHQSFWDASEAHQNNAIKISQVLGNLPEALEFASLHLNYIYGNRGKPIQPDDERLRNYLEIYRKNRHNLQKIHERLPRVDGKKGVAYAWYLFFQQFKKKVPEAGEMLLLCSLLGQSVIPLAIIRQAFKLIPAYQSLSDAEIDLTLGELLKLSLLEREDMVVMMNSHIQDYLIGSDSTRRAELASYVIKSIGLTFPEIMIIDDIQQCRQYEPHVKACEALIQKHPLETIEVAQLYDRYGCYLREIDSYQDAEEYLKKGFNLYKKILPDSLQVAGSISNLADLYYAQCKFNEAKELYQDALQIYLQQATPNTLDIAMVKSNIAIVYKELHNIQNAEKLHEEALESWEPLLEAGKAPVSFSILNVKLLKRMAYAYAFQNKYPASVKMYEEALAICDKEAAQRWGKRKERLLETDICSASIVLCDFVQKNKNEYVKIEIRYRETLRRCEEILGKRHTQVAAIHHTLANLLKELFEDSVNARRLDVQSYKEALLHYKEAITIYKQKLPDKASIITDLESKQQELEKAILLFDKN